MADLLYDKDRYKMLRLIFYQVNPVHLIKRPYLFSFNFVQGVFYILDGDLLNSALLV